MWMANVHAAVRSSLTCLLLLVASFCLSVSLEEDEGIFQLPINMPATGKTPPKHNDYRCRALELPESDNYIVSYEPQADPNVAHHMLVYGCRILRDGLRDSSSWNCKSSTVCGSLDVPKIIYAWALNASGFQLPPGVGQKVGPSVNINYLVVQIHYGEMEELSAPTSENPTALLLYMTSHSQERVSGVFLLGSSNRIPPGEEAVTKDTACRFGGPKMIVPIAFRTHAHAHSTLIVGYVGDGMNNWNEIGFRSPQDPQAFYPVTNEGIKVHTGDWLAARCVYNTSGRSHSIHMGPDSEDEMCNFYIMYHTKNDERSLTRSDCWETAPSHIHFPPLPTLPPSHGMQHHHHDHSSMGGGANEEIEIIEPITSFDDKTTSSSLPDDENRVQDEDGDYMCPSPIPPGPASQCMKNGNGDSVDGDDITSLDIALDDKWPYNGIDYPQFDIVTGMVGALGQMTSVAIATDGSVYILHRGPRVWDASTFSYTNIYMNASDGPISTPTVLKFTSDGVLEETSGAGIFYLPHSITVDKNGGLWFTDVALHQVLKFDSIEAREPSLVLGHKLTPGANPGYFCKPADVAVATSGKFYVADGYCNSRVVAYDANGVMKTILGNFPIEKEMMFVPHSLTLNPTQDRLYVADRENDRIVSIDVSRGRVEVLSAVPGLGRVFGVSFSGLSAGGWPLVAVSNTKSDVDGYGVAVGQGGEIVTVWGVEQRFKKVHDLAVDTTARAVYVTELNPPRIWKFLLDVSVNTTQSGALTQTPPIASDQPHVTTTQPPSTTEQPQGTTTQPPSTTEQPTDQTQTTTEQPQSTTEQPHSTTTKQPDIKTQQPTGTTTEHSPQQTTQQQTTTTTTQDPTTTDSQTTTTTSNTTSDQSPEITTSTQPETMPTATSTDLEELLTTSTPSDINLPTTPDLDHIDDTDELTSAPSPDGYTAEVAVGNDDTNTHYRFSVKTDKHVDTPVYQYGIFAAIFAIVGLILLVVIGILKEHRHCRFRGRRSLPGDGSKIQTPRETLHSLLGPSKLGFSRLRTYDSDSEAEEFPIFSRQS